jgi:hypothetical protein
MNYRVYSLVLILFSALALHGQTTSRPFFSLEHALKTEGGGWARGMSKLS